MKKLVYPVILFKSEEENNYTVLIPDLDIVACGDTVEKAYLSAEDYLETFLGFASKMESPITPATSFEDTQKLNPKKIVLLAGAECEVEVELSEYEKQYKNFVQQFVLQTED